MASIFDRLLLVKSEVTKGVDALPTAADAIKVLDITLTPKIDTILRKTVSPFMGEDPHAMGKRSLEFKIKAELKGSGTPGVAGEADPLFLACQLKKTVTAAVAEVLDPITGAVITPAVAGKVEYTPTTRTPTPCTIYLYKDGQLWTGVGAVGTFVLNGDIGTALVADMTFSCKWTDPVAATIPANPVYDTTGPAVALETSIVNENGITVRTGTFNFDRGNNVVEHYTTGYHEFTVADAAPVMKVTKDSVSTTAEWLALKNGDTISIDATFGEVAGNQIQILAANSYRMTMNYGLRHEKDIIDVTYKAVRVNGDDEFTIVVK